MKKRFKLTSSELVNTYNNFYYLYKEDYSGNLVWTMYAKYRDSIKKGKFCQIQVPREEKDTLKSMKDMFEWMKGRLDRRARQKIFKPITLKQFKKLMEKQITKK